MTKQQIIYEINDLFDEFFGDDGEFMLAEIELNSIKPLPKKLIDRELYLTKIITINNKNKENSYAGLGICTECDENWTFCWFRIWDFTKPQLLEILRQLKEAIND